MISSPTSVEVPVKNLVFHTLHRILEAYQDEITENCRCLGETIEAKFLLCFGQDGSSHQSRFNQKLSENSDDSSIFTISMNPLQIATDEGKILYRNSSPQSSRSVRVQKITFCKENADLNKSEYRKTCDALNEFKDEIFQFELISGN